MTANIYYILWYIHHKLYICDRYIYIFFNHTSFLPFVLKRYVGWCFFSLEGHICSQSLSALFWSHWRGRWWSLNISWGNHPQQIQQSAPHRKFCIDSIIQGPIDHNIPGCCLWKQEDLPGWMPVKKVPSLRLLFLKSSVSLCCSDKFPRTRICIKTLLSSFLENLKISKG